MPVENGAGYLTRRTQAIVHAAVTGDEEALAEALTAEGGEGGDGAVE